MVMHTVYKPLACLNFDHRLDSSGGAFNTLMLRCHLKPIASESRGWDPNTNSGPADSYIQPQVETNCPGMFPSSV